MLEVAAILVLAITAILYVRFRRTQYYQMGNKIPGPTAIPFFGNILGLIGREGKLKYILKVLILS